MALNSGVPPIVDDWASAGSRRLSYLTKVQFNGNLLLGKAYTAQLGRKQIEILPIGTADEEG